ncbi:MAG: RdgB/HAM1 family non-canonical purine NTP pyrophosphatase [Opitutales bacterium]
MTTARPQIALATGNAHKVAELSDWLGKAGLPVDVVSAEAFGGMPEVEETGLTFEANARLKAEGLRAAAVERAQPLPWLILTDDSGLEVDALGGAPGVFSARFAGAGASDARNNAKLLAALEEVPEAERTARFVCHLYGLMSDGRTLSLRGEVTGRIASEAAGEQGFGYDPLFVPDGYAETFGQLGADVKQRISHRSRALAALAERLPELLKGDA